MPSSAPLTMALICLLALFKLNFPSVRCAPNSNDVAKANGDAKKLAKAFGDLFQQFEQNSKHNCFEKTDQKKFKIQKDAIKKSLNELSKNETIDNGQLDQLLNQFDQLADSVLKSGKGTVEAMEPYSNMVKLDSNNTPVKYFELIYEAERKKLTKCFSEAKSDDLLQNVLREANAMLFEQVYQKFISLATLTFLLNELSNNRNEFNNNFVLSVDGGRIYKFKKSYGQMRDENQRKIERIVHTQRNIEYASFRFTFCCMPYCAGEMKSRCLVPLCCATDFTKCDRHVTKVDKECGGAYGCVGSLCWLPTFGLLSAPFFGIAWCGTECQKGKLVKKGEKLERLIEAKKGKGNA